MGYEVGCEVAVCGGGLGWGMRWGVRWRSVAAVWGGV